VDIEARPCHPSATVPARAALGFRSHRGWAAAAVVGGSIRRPELVLRTRVELCEPSADLPAAVYHHARELDIERAARLVAAVRAAAIRQASDEIARLIGEAAGCGARVRTSAVLVGAMQLPDRLDAILATHARVHAAEGELYRDALVEGSEKHGLKTARMPERLVWEQAATTLGLGTEDLRRRVHELGRSLGPPWTQDEKLATLAAWLALARA
jgi:hypothetical protein